MASVQEKIARLDKEEEEKEAEEMRLLRLAEKDQSDDERKYLNERRAARGEKPLPRVSTGKLKIFEDHTIADVNRKNWLSDKQKTGSGGRRGKKRSCKKRSCKKRSCKKRSCKKRSCKK